ncbi:MAG TPA: hypothetical protein VLT86_08075 [Vicinamibacterales bacterium]|nr:hypothetical protein [Vicinamibacterales bacterium]
MVRRHLAPVLVLSLALLLVISRGSSGSVSGNSDPTLTFHGFVKGPDGREQYHIVVDVEPTTFLLASVASKYRLARMRVQNSTASPLTLSADQDRLELVPPSGPAVAAILNLQSGDSPFWDSLTAATRERLAYPVAVNGTPAPATGGPPRAPEALYVYLFFPQAQVPTVPASFTYRIASLGQTIKLERSAPKAS